MITMGGRWYYSLLANGETEAVQDHTAGSGGAGT